MQITGSAPLGLNVTVDPFRLPGFAAEHSSQFFGGNLVVQGPERQVHLVVGECEVELVLALGQAVGVGGGLGGADLLGQAQVTGELVDLGLVEMGDGFDIRRAVAVLDEKALVIFQAVGGPTTA